MSDETHKDDRRLPATERAWYPTPPMQKSPAQDGPELSVVIPLYNEEANVEPLLSELFGVLRGLARTHEVICVDDGSRDATFARLAALAAREPALRVIRFRLNFGQTAAMSAGIEGARGTVIVVNHRARRAGTSKYGLNRTVKVLLDLLVVKFLASYATKPIYVFGGFGLLSWLSAGCAAAWAIYYKVRGLKDFVQTPL